MSQSKPFVPPQEAWEFDYDSNFKLHHIVGHLLKWNSVKAQFISSVGSRPSIDILINALALKALVDSGAEVSVVDCDQLHKMSPPPTLLNPNASLFDAQNRPMSCAGLYLVHIATPTPSGQPVSISLPVFAVRGLGTQAIMGWDFLRKTRALIKAGDGTVSFEGSGCIGAVASPMESASDEVYLLESSEKVLIPAGETRDVTGVITTPDGHQLTPGSDVMVESNPSTDVFTPDVLLKVRDKNSLRIMVRNNCPWDLEIKQKELIPGVTVEPCQSFKIFALTDQVLEDLKKGSEAHVCSVNQSPSDKGHFKEDIQELRQASGVKDSKTSVTKIHQLDPEKRRYLLENLDLTGVDVEFREKYIEFVIQNHDVFSRNKWDMGRATSFEHVIHMVDDKPVFVPQFKLPHAYQDAVEDMVKEMLRAKVIVPARSPYNSPIFCVYKKNGSLRFVQDFRSINFHSFDDKYSIQDVRECLNSVGRCRPRIFSGWDLSGAFWQMPLAAASMPYTAFTVPHMNQQFMWTRAAMGLKGCPSSFSRYMGFIFRDFKGKCVTYIDDALFLSQNHHEHLKVLNLAAAVLRKEGLKLNIKKCHFGRREITFLGFHLSSAGISPDRDKMKALRNLPPPSSQRQVSEYLGCFNYFRTLIRDFANVSAPLAKLTSKLSPWKKGPLPPDALKAFHSLVEAVCAPPVLAFADPNKPYILSTDAAHGDPERPGGIAAILTQKGDDGVERLIGCFSRSLKSHQRKWSAYAVELLACIEGLNYFDEFCRGQKTFVITDHKPIQGHSVRHEKTISELQDKLNKYDVTVQYRKGSLNPADAISRTVASVSCAGLTNSLYGPGQWGDMISEQQKDPLIRSIKKFLECKELPMENPLRQLTCDLAPKCYITDDLLWVIEQRKGRVPKPRLFLPKSKVDSVIANAHGNTLSGHFKLARTVERCLEEYFWCSIASDVSEYISRCRTCSILSDPKGRNATAPLTPWPQSSRFNQRVHCDLVGPLRSASDNKWVLVATDSFSKWVKLAAMRNKEAKTVAETFMDVWVFDYSCPFLLVTDGGKEFHNKVLGELLKLLKSSHHVITSHHPRAAGQVERFNREMKDYLTAFVAPDTLNWEDFLKPLQLAHNTALNRSTCMTPYFVVFSQDPTLPWSLTNPQTTISESWAADKYRTMLYARELVMVNNTAAREAYRKYFDKNLKNKPFQVGDQVLVFFKDPPKGINPKFHRAWQGPYRVQQVLDLNVCVVKRLNDDKLFQIHNDRLKHFNQVDDPHNVELKLSHGGQTVKGPSKPQGSRPTKASEVSVAGQLTVLEEANNLQCLERAERNVGQVQGNSNSPSKVNVDEIPVRPVSQNLYESPDDNPQEVELDTVSDKQVSLEPEVSSPAKSVNPEPPPVPSAPPSLNTKLDNLARQVFPPSRPTTRHQGVPPGHFDKHQNFHRTQK